ncbi:MAG: TrmH family RNA methyltransferase [bacterium]
MSTTNLSEDDGHCLYLKPILQKLFYTALFYTAGNETYGLSNNYKAIYDILIKIPISGNITSFNVACTASIILYEITR